MNENATHESKPQFSIKWLLVVVAIAAIGIAAFRFTQEVLDVPADAYAMWAAGDVLIDYMAQNNGNWPTSWRDLADRHADSGGGDTMVGPFSEMEARIRIDFTFDPQSELQTLDTKDIAPKFRVVLLKVGGDTHWSGRELPISNDRVCPRSGISDEDKWLSGNRTTQ